MQIYKEFFLSQDISENILTPRRTDAFDYIFHSRKFIKKCKNTLITTQLRNKLLQVFHTFERFYKSLHPMKKLGLFLLCIAVLSLSKATAQETLQYNLTQGQTFKVDQWAVQDLSLIHI